MWWKGLVTVISKCLNLFENLQFASHRSALATLAGIELWRMLKKGQSKSSQPAWQQFYALAAAG
jgi:hypothetical protein